jgi:transcriptional regulator with XRE-family HTH domain
MSEDGPRRVDVTYGEQLKRLRLGMQPPMVQQHLADLLGVHVTTSSRWETDQSVPALGQIRRLARALRVLSISCSRQRRWTGRPTTVRHHPNERLAG